MLQYHILYDRLDMSLEDEIYIAKTFAAKNQEKTDFRQRGFEARRCM